MTRHSDSSEPRRARPLATAPTHQPGLAPAPFFFGCLLFVLGGLLGGHATGKAGDFRVGACAIDVTPEKLPVHALGMFTDRMADKVVDRLYARCLVLDDGRERVAIVVVDSCMMPRDLLDHAKELARQKTGIRADRILISATHTHSAPAAMGGLGTPPDEEYVKMLPPRLAEGIARAARTLVPARAGWAVVSAPEFTHTRRWIFHPDKMLTDPFGNRSVRANMHPGYQNPDAICPSGPSDPDITVLAFQSLDGRPLAVLANYSMHYYDSPLLSADYYGRFAARVAALMAPAPADRGFVAIMSQGTSGDQMWMDYGKAANPPGLDAYAEAIAAKVVQACQRIKYRQLTPLRMREAALTLRFRIPSPERLAWAEKLVGELKGRPPQNLPEVYALEQIYLARRPQAELKLQALRLGDVGIATFPNEVFAVSGLKIKERSPLRPTFSITCANGAEGYIPPPEQHLLGGYTTWPARTAGLEEEAEPKIVEQLLALLEEVGGKPPRRPDRSPCPYARAVLSAAPLAYWRCSELNGPHLVNLGPRVWPARQAGPVAFALDGPQLGGVSGDGAPNRAVYLAGGSFRAVLSSLRKPYTVETWFWNGLTMPRASKDSALVICCWDTKPDAPWEGLMTLASEKPEFRHRLVFRLCPGAKARDFVGGTEIAPRTWNHVVLVREKTQAKVYLNGNPTPLIAADLGLTQGDLGAKPVVSAGAPLLVMGATLQGQLGFEGKLDEVAVYRRALSINEIAAHYQAAQDANHKKPSSAQ